MNESGPLVSICDRVGAFPFQGGGDAALLLRLESGSYSAVVRGAWGAVGDAMLEIYELP